MPGDRIFVAPGEYRENLVMDRSGERDKPMVIEGMKGSEGMMRITGFGEGSGDPVLVGFYGACWVQFRGFVL